MKRTVILISTFILIMSMVASAFAGGPPPKDLLKGYFTETNEANRSVQFVKDNELIATTLFLNNEMSMQDIRLDKKVMVTLDKHAGENVIGDISIMFMDLPLKKIGALLLIGLIGGLLSGFIGSGGAFVMTPAMMTLGAPGAIAVASNMCHKFPKAMVGAYKRYKYGQVDIKLGLVMAVTAIIGVEIGIKMQKYILNTWGNAGSNLYVSVVFVAVLVIVGLIVARDAYKLSRGKAE
ncbi:MAG: sulfite exporter TauE/SafE family protein, partial [Desulfobulbaceae bacterium]|nr:sulfite exporter TauE/SafE family protein [Desulfobulbaceae bacterium]